MHWGPITTVLERWKRVGGAERRQHPRITEKPLCLKIDGKRYRVADWSLGGCRVGPLHRQFAYGDVIEGRICAAGPVPSGTFSAEVVRPTEDGGYGLRWREVDAKTFYGLSLYVHWR